MFTNKVDQIMRQGRAVAHCVPETLAYWQCRAKCLKAAFDKFARNTAGTVAVIFAVAIIPVLGLVGAAIDYANAIRLKQQIASSIDAAALAAGSAIDLTAAARVDLAKQFIKSNFTDVAGVSVGEPNIVVGENTVTITMSGSVNTSLLGVIGIDDITVTVANEVRLKDTKLELALVLDTTGSMSGSKIATLRTSVKDLIDTLYAKDNAKDMIKVGIVPFAAMVNVGTQYEDADWLDMETNLICKKGKGKGKGKCTPQPWFGCVVPRDGVNHVNDAPAAGNAKIPADYSNCQLKSLLPLTTNKQDLKTKASTLSAQGMTYIPGGLAWGWRILSPNVPFTDVAAYDDEKWTKALVLMTDGANTINYYNTGASADSNTETICEKIKDTGITVYTVAFQITSKTTKKMIQGCATKPSYYYDATNNAALQAAFSSIAEQLSQLRISK